MITPHEDRERIRACLCTLWNEGRYDASGINRAPGKLENSYEATAYFHALALEGDHGEGLISFADGSSETAFEVSPMERAMIAGPWDQSGNVFNVHGADLLFLLCETADGFAVGSHVGREEWALRMREQEEEGED